MAINNFNILTPRPSSRNYKNKKKFRGKKRYYRNLNNKIDAWLDSLSDADLQNSWHAHADFYGYGNLGGKHRLGHLKVLCKIFRHVASMVKERDDVFIWMHFDCNADASLDSFYFNMKDDDEVTYYDPHELNLNKSDDSFLNAFLENELSPHNIEIHFCDISCDMSRRYYVSLESA